MHYRFTKTLVICVFVFQESPKKSNPEGGNLAYSKTEGGQKVSSSTQLLHFQQDEAADMPGKGGGSQKRYEIADAKGVKCVIQLLDGSDYETFIDVRIIDDKLRIKI